MPALAIRRERLEHLLDEHPERQTILVRGPVGAGKTVLVTQWVRRLGSPVAWLSTEACHNDRDRLLWSVIEAVERLAPDAASTVVTGWRVRNRIDHTVLWDLLELVAQALGQTIILVFDDIDQLRDKAARHVVRRLVERPPDPVRIVLTSRSKPRLGLERARLRGDLVEIPPAALRFERSEMEELLASWDGSKLDTSELEQLTLGWAAGLRLAQLDATADGSASLECASVSVADEYVREELLGALRKDVCAFLEVTCWLPILTEAVQAAATSQDRRQRPLRSSDLEALPILPVASHPGTFRYPPILAEAVQRELGRHDPQAAVSARHRAAEACRRSGELCTAVELFLDAGSDDEAADVCAELAATGEAALTTVDDLLHRIPDGAPTSHRWLPWRIRAAVAAGHLEEGRLLLEHAGRSVPARDAADGDGADLTVARAVVAERTGDVPTLLTAADRLLTAAERNGLDPTARRRAHGWRVRGLAWRGDLEGARAAARAMDQWSADPAPAAAIDRALARGWVSWLNGDMTKVSDSLAALPVTNGDHAEWEPAAALLMASVHRERGRLAKALPLAQEAHALAVASSHRVIGALAASELARCHLAAGAVMDALELVVSTRSARSPLPAAVDARLRDAEVRARLGRGDVDGARDLLRGAPQGVDTKLTAVRVALRQAPDTARDLLEAVDTETSRQAVERLLLYAQLPEITEADASAALVAAISAGGHLGLARIFLDEGPEMVRRLQQLTLDSPDSTLGRLAALASRELALAPTRGSSELLDPLTPRELAVLRLLPLQMTNREIAAQLYISPNTLKTHIRAIYRKLDVPHRSGAVRRAEALQLV